MAQTWVNRRLVNEAYDIGLFLKDGETVESKFSSGEGTTYFVKGKDGQRSVIKVYNCELTEQLEKSLRIVSDLDHVAITRVLEYGEDANHAYERRECYDRSNYINAPECFAISVRELADAIRQLHFEGFDVLDIKSDNIVVTGAGAVIVDVGSFVGFKKNGTVGYTLAYCAPELKDGNYNFKNDFFSLGVSLFELICGVNPFSELKGDELHLAKTHPQWWLPSEAVSNELGELLLGLLEPDPNKRWGYGEVNDWYGKIDPAVIAHEVLELNARFNSGLKYDDVQMTDAGELVRGVIAKWDLDYLFDRRAELSYIEPVLAIKTALNRKETDGKFGEADKAAGLVAVYCYFSNYDDKVYLNGTEFPSVFELGNYIYNSVTNIYGSLAFVSSNYNKLMGDRTFLRLQEAATAGVFSCYIRNKAREENAKLRSELADSAVSARVSSDDFYNAIYGMVLISYTLLSRNILSLPSHTNRNTEVTTHRGFADVVEENLWSYQNANDFLSSLLYRDMISPIVMAWSDYTNKINQLR